MHPAPPDHLAPTVRAALDDAAEALRALYGDRLHALVLYGSQARGDAHDESDVDVLVVLDDEVDFVAEVKRMLDLRMNVLRRYTLLLSLIPVARITYEDETHPLMMNVHREGIALP